MGLCLRDVTNKHLHIHTHNSLILKIIAALMCPVMLGPKDRRRMKKREIERQSVTERDEKMRENLKKKVTQSMRKKYRD